MPPDRGRASKACATCRRQKTRCYAGTGSASACLRCQTLDLNCSLTESPVPNEGTRVNEGSSSETAARLQRLENTVNRLVDRLEDILPDSNAARISRSETAPSRESSRPGADPAPAPMLMLRDLAVETGYKSPEVRQNNALSTDLGVDIISQGLLNYQDATMLIAIFQEHYGRWVAFDADIAPEELLQKVRESDLLLCTCCLIAVRHTSEGLAARLAPLLFDRAKNHISLTLLTTPQPLEFFQAALILCMWSTTVGQTPLSLDSWLLSGFALQHCLTSGHFDVVLGAPSTARASRSLLARWSIWNHLCLVHLHYCVGTRRISMVGPIRIDRCTKILEFDHCSNFQTRMVAEIDMYWRMYESLAVAQVDLPKVRNALLEWSQKWDFLLHQPRSQFIQMGFKFAPLLAYERALHSKSAKAKYNLLNEMATLCLAIINLAIETTDDRTKHLTDHIFHMITFAAITLCRLLSLYEAQIATTRNIVEIDSLIINLVDWLHAIGLPCHAGYNFGSIISAFHKKLRPNAHSHLASPMTDWSSAWNASELTQFFPEWLGGETEGGSNFNMLPDWEPYYQGPPT